MWIVTHICHLKATHLYSADLITVCIFNYCYNPKREEAREGITEEKLIFRLSLKCEMIVNEVNKSWVDGKTPEMQRSASLEEHIWSSSKCPGGWGGGLQGAPLAGSIRSRGGWWEREHSREWEEERAWGGFCVAEQLFLAELPVLSALKEILYHTSTTACIICLSVTIPKYPKLPTQESESINYISI